VLRTASWRRRTPPHAGADQNPSIPREANGSGTPGLALAGGPGTLASSSGCVRRVQRHRIHPLFWWNRA